MITITKKNLMSMYVLKSAAIIFIITLFSVKSADAVTLTADNNQKTAYQEITSAGFMYETPDNSRQHGKKPTAHIAKIFDDQLNKYVFQFTIHALIDDDRGIKSVTDRQRVEIKTYDASPKELVANEKETFLIRYKMRLPDGFKTTAKFCHLHQLKGIDNKEHTADVKHPLITLTACSKKGGTQKLELRYFDRKIQKASVLQSAPLEAFLDNWVEITEKITFGTNKISANNGKYSISIKRLKDDKNLLTFSSDSLDLWQTDCKAMRPKWGIYRSLGENRIFEKELRDENIRFADFSVEKIATANNDLNS